MKLMTMMKRSFTLATFEDPKFTFEDPTLSLPRRHGEDLRNNHHLRHLLRGKGLLKKVRRVLLTHSERLPTHSRNLLRNWPLKHLKFLTGAAS
jgi:hypothetical protein